MNDYIFLITGNNFHARWELPENYIHNKFKNAQTSQNLNEFPDDFSRPCGRVSRRPKPFPHTAPTQSRTYRILINTTGSEAGDNVLRLRLNDRVMQMSVAGLSEDLRNTENESRSTGRWLTRVRRWRRLFVVASYYIGEGCIESRIL